jgi:hypothetical protein
VRRVSASGLLNLRSRERARYPHRFLMTLAFLPTKPRPDLGLRVGQGLEDFKCDTVHQCNECLFTVDRYRRCTKSTPVKQCRIAPQATCENPFGGSTDCGSSNWYMDSGCTMAASPPTNPPPCVYPSCS